MYPSGVVVSPFCSWMAATPDRKVYAPDRNMKHGLLEIKCPVTDDLGTCDCLQKLDDGYKLKENHNYYYQVQMAVTGLDWCDFFVWIEEDSHLETIHFLAESQR